MGSRRPRRWPTQRHPLPRPGSWPERRAGLRRPKSESSRRTIPLTRAKVDALRRHLLATGRPGPDALVFARPDGRPLEAQNMPRRLLWAACKLAEIGDPLPRFHDLRHSYATAMLAAGVTPHAVARLLGHASAQLVYERYGHARPDELAGAAERLEALLSGGLSAVGGSP